jgi:hypothetical protein
VHVAAVTDNGGPSLGRNVHPMLKWANEPAQRLPEWGFDCRYGHGVHAVQAVQA